MKIDFTLLMSLCVTNNLYADGKGPRYDYDANGRLTRRTWARGIDTFYAYDGWGNLTNTTYTVNELNQYTQIAASNPWRFSSEYADDELGCDYYNYREYEPVSGRWLQRDPIGESGGVAIYCNSYNRMIINFDCVGLGIDRPNPFWIGRANVPKYPKFLAGSKWGADDDMWQLPHGVNDLKGEDRGSVVETEVGKTLFGSSLYRYDFSDKKFRYGWYLYVRDAGGEWREEDSNDDMYATWTTATPGHFLPKNDEHVRTMLRCCQAAIVVHGDKGSPTPSVEGVFETPCPRK